MTAALLAAAALAFVPPAGAEGSGSRQAPSYSAASIVNAASNVAGAVAPYTLVTIYGTELAYPPARAVVPEDIRDNILPTLLNGVRVLIDGVAAQLYLVSPEQVNLLIPYDAGRSFPTEVTVTLTLDGRAGPAVRLQLREAAPALFQKDADTVVATHSDWSPIAKDSPARPGEEIVLFATGLGRTTPHVDYPYLPKQGAQIAKKQAFQVQLGGVPVDAARITYVGITPGFAGLYQINLKLPDKLEKDPEIRISLDGEVSPAGPRLPCAPN